MVLKLLATAVILYASLSGVQAQEAPAKAGVSAPMPLQGFAKRDIKGTPVVPEWKMQAGYDELLGKFYVGMLGLKIAPINGPPPAALLGASQLKHWHGHKSFPCVLRFTKLQDDTGGYYFQTVASAEGPRGWIIPQPIEPHKTKTWAIYFMQLPEAQSDDKSSNK